MSELRRAVESALDGPDATSHYECAHCGAVADEWADDCSKCGGAVMRIVTEIQDGPCRIDG